MKPTLTRKIIYIEGSDKETIDFYSEYFHNDSYANYMQGIDERVDLICAGGGYRECQSNFDYFCIQAEMYINEKQQDLTHTIITNQLELLEQLSINSDIISSINYAHIFIIKCTIFCFQCKIII